MFTPPKISIVVNNYNYGRFLLRAIDSALAQEYDNFEVLVVDDGSTDNSLSIARSRASPRLQVIEKANGGQASAINAGFMASTGDWVMFLDADDWYEPNALQTLQGEFNSGVAKVQFPLTRYYETAGEMGGVYPKNLSRGDVVYEVAESGNYEWPPTTGNIFRRDALDRIMPIPEAQFKICADIYLCLMVVAYGTIASLDRPLGFYCVHGSNAYAQTSFRFEKKYLCSQALGHLLIAQVAEQVLKKRGILAKLTELDQRENLEIVVIAVRFGAIRLEDFNLSWEKLRLHWRTCYRSSANTLRSRIPALCIWNVIYFAPLPVVRLIMRLLGSFRSRRFDRLYQGRV